MIEDRLRKYTMTIGTTIAAAAAGSAHAGIVSSVGPVTVAPNESETLFNFGGGGMVAQNRVSTSPWNFRSLRVGGTNSDLDIDFNVNNVGAGTTINSSFISGTKSSANAKTKSTTPGSPFAAPYNIDTGANQLLAFRMEVTGETGIYFGWIDYTLDASGNASNPYTFTVNAWAYNDVADQGIIAGQALAAGSSGGGAVPGLGGLAALAAGAAGVRTRRQRIS